MEKFLTTIFWLYLLCVACSLVALLLAYGTLFAIRAAIPSQHRFHPTLSKWLENLPRTVPRYLANILFYGTLVALIAVTVFHS